MKRNVTDVIRTYTVDFLSMNTNIQHLTQSTKIYVN